jgi:hypothetical protein
VVTLEGGALSDKKHLGGAFKFSLWFRLGRQGTRIMLLSHRETQRWLVCNMNVSIHKLGDKNKVIFFFNEIPIPSDFWFFQDCLVINFRMYFVVTLFGTTEAIRLLLLLLLFPSMWEHLYIRQSFGISHKLCQEKDFSSGLYPSMHTICFLYLYIDYLL